MVLAQNPARDSGYYALGEHYLDAGDYGRAAAYFEKTVNIKKNHFAAHYLLAWILTQKGSYGKAVSHLKINLKLNPSSPEVLELTGRVFLLQGKAGEAAGYYKKSVEFGPDRPSAWVGLGLALETLGKTGDAYMAYDRANFLDPENGTALVGLARMQAGMGDFGRAESSVDLALESNGADVQALLYKACLLWNRKEDEAARAAVAKVLKINPVSTQARLLAKIFASPQSAGRPVERLLEITRSKNEIFLKEMEKFPRIKSQLKEMNR
jgi:tetratricopeptide (TPR) repeat protein